MGNVSCQSYLSSVLQNLHPRRRPDGWGNGLDFQTPRFEQFAAWVSDMKAIGIPVIWNSGWWFTQNSCNAGKPANCTPTEESLAIYTEVRGVSICFAFARLCVTLCASTVDLRVSPRARVAAGAHKRSDSAALHRAAFLRLGYSPA